MPQIALGAEEVTARGWLVAPGEGFSLGQAILEIETDKATMEVEAPFAGILLEQLCQDGDSVAVGGVIGVAAEVTDDLGTAHAEVDAVRPVAGAAPVSQTGGASELAAATSARGPSGDAPAPASSGAATAEVTWVVVEHGELAGLPAQSSDCSVLASLPPAGSVGAAPDALDDRAAAGPCHERQLNRRRTAVGRRMTLAANIPSFLVSRDIDAAAALAAVERSRATGADVTFTDHLLLACAAAARANPSINSWYTPGILLEFEHVNIALAVDTPLGVIAPVLRGVEAMTLSEIATARRGLVQRAREDTIDGRELTGATITVSNIGSLGAHAVSPVLTAPQVAALGVGAAHATHHGIVITSIFVGDHRALDGADGARFLGTLSDVFEGIDAPA